MRLGYIGGGTDSVIGGTHRFATRLDGRWDVVAGCFSVDAQANAETAALCGVADDMLFSTWEAMLKQVSGCVDAIVVITPIPLHRDIVIAALESGYPVICEKALAVSAAEAAEIREAVETHRGFLAVTYNYTGYPMLRELRMLIRNGVLGKLIQVHIEMPQETYLRVSPDGGAPSVQPWRLKDYSVPTVSLDLGTHVHNIAGFLSGEKPCEVVAVQDSYGFFSQVVDNVAGIVRYTSDLTCQVWFGKCALGHRNGFRVRVYGDQGSAEWYQMQPEELIFHDNAGNESRRDRSLAGAMATAEPRYHRFKAGHPAGFIEAFANHYCDIADALVEYRQSGRFDNPWVFGVDHAEEGLQLLEAMAVSARTKRWEPVGPRTGS